MTMTKEAWAILIFGAVILLFATRALACDHDFKPLVTDPEGSTRTFCMKCGRGK